MRPVPTAVRYSPKRLHWSFPDPAALTGSHQERLDGVRKIRDQIRARIEMWCDEMCGVEV